MRYLIKEYKYEIQVVLSLVVAIVLIIALSTLLNSL